MALAHAVGDKVEAAYRRGDLFQKRRRMMDDWAKYCGTIKPASQVIGIGSAQKAAGPSSADNRDDTRRSYVRDEK